VTTKDTETPAKNVTQKKTADGSSSAGQHNFAKLDTLATSSHNTKKTLMHNYAESATTLSDYKTNEQEVSAYYSQNGSPCSSSIGTQHI
jgi:hypothetical protein